MVVSSIMQIVSNNFMERLTAEMDQLGVPLQQCSLALFLELYPKLSGAEPFDLDEDSDIGTYHYIYSFCILSTLIGKGLNVNNYVNWLRQRSRSFGAPLSLSENDPNYKRLEPSLPFAREFNNEIKVNRRIQRLYFGFLCSMAKQGDILGTGCKIVINLLRNAELTNMAMILTWILTLNDVLLMVSELNRFVPHLCAAVAKYNQLGDMAPWAKLILPPEELTEFSTEKLRTLYAVARGIAAKYGSSTVNQIEGTGKSEAVDKIINQALRIISAAGGSKTVDTMALRDWKMNGHSNPLLEAELVTGITLDDPLQLVDQPLDNQVV